jgi:hypothetical protein
MSIYKNGRLTEKSLKLLEEFRNFEVEKITKEHIQFIDEYSKGWDGRLSTKDNKKLIEVSLYLISIK